MLLDPYRPKQQHIITKVCKRGALFCDKTQNFFFVFWAALTHVILTLFKVDINKEQINNPPSGQLEKNKFLLGSSSSSGRDSSRGTLANFSACSLNLYNKKKNDNFNAENDLYHGQISTLVKDPSHEISAVNQDYDQIYPAQRLPTHKHFPAVRVKLSLAAEKCRSF